MASRPAPQLLLGAAVALSLAASLGPGPVSADGGWLDRPLVNWNAAGMTVPAAPPAPAGMDPRCADQERPPEGYEDSLVTAAGWRLVGEYRGGWGVQVVTGTSGYDGMCRPMGYQVFVFSGGAFAGTISPTPMDSRFDGSGRVANVNRERLTGTFSRYTASDALCCPSAISSVEFRVDAAGGAPVLVPVSASTNPTGQAPPPPPSPAPAAAASPVGPVWVWQDTQLPDGQTVTPMDPTRYTFELQADGRAAIRLDCNRGGGTYKLAGNALTFSAIMSTRVGCPNGSLGTVFADHLGRVATFAFEGEVLRLDLRDGGAMRFVAKP